MVEAVVEVVEVVEGVEAMEGGRRRAPDSRRSSDGVKRVKPPAPLVRGMIVTFVTMS